MAKVYDVVASMGEYQDRDGNTKVRWQNCGAIFETKNGLALKLDAIPAGNSWEGWFKLFEPKTQQAGSKANQGRATDQREAARSAAGLPSGGFDDEIPF